MSTIEATFGNTDDLAVWLGTSWDTPEAESQAQLALDAAAGVIRDLTGQHLTLVTDDQQLMDWRSELALYLPQLPVVDVAAVEARQLIGPDADPDTWLAWPEEQLQWSERTGELRLSCQPFAWWTAGGWPAWWGHYPGIALRAIRVTYTHGYDPLPADLASVAYSMAGRMLSAPDGSVVTSETIGAYAYQISAGAIANAGSGWASGLTGPEAAVISRYRRPNPA